MKHYFLTYKLAPEEAGDVNIGDAYGHKHAESVVQSAIDDYGDFTGE